MSYLKLFRKLAILAVLATAAFAFAKPAQPVLPTNPSTSCPRCVFSPRCPHGGYTHCFPALNYCVCVCCD
jgi:hypothetical protein